MPKLIQRGDSVNAGERGFSLVELLSVLAILGIIAAILIPNLLISLQKAKQKRTMAEMRNVGTAWMSWLTDQVGATAAGTGKVYDASSFSERSYVELHGYLHPGSTFFYMQEVPEVDGWKNPMSFAMADNLLAAKVLVVCSGGADGHLSDGDCTKRYRIGAFVATDFNQDIIWADGYFVRWPSALGTGDGD